MAIFERSHQSIKPLDLTHPLQVTIINTQVVKGHTEYILKVTSGWICQSSTWQLYKRYKDFHQLNNEFKKDEIHLNLPPKKYLGNLNQKFVAERQAALQEYLNRILEDPILSLTTQIRHFLEEPKGTFSIQRFTESSVQNISMILHSEGCYELETLMPRIGWRCCKQYYSVKKLNTHTTDQYLLSYVQYGTDRIVKDTDLIHMTKMLTNLRHPFIEPIELLHCTSSGFVKIQKVNPTGSLHDVICSSKYKDSYLKKYFTAHTRMPLDRQRIITYSIQILNALKFLHSRNLYHGHLHAGNILVIDLQNIRLTEIENSILGLCSFHRPRIIQHRKLCAFPAIDIYSFGRVLYEMCTGHILSKHYCAHVPDYVDVDLRLLLESILSTKSIAAGIPSVENILSLPMFQGYVPDPRLQNTFHIKAHASVKTKLVTIYETIEQRLLQDQKQSKEEHRIHKIEEILKSDDAKSQLLAKHQKSSRESLATSNNDRTSFSSNEPTDSSSTSTGQSTAPTEVPITSPTSPLPVTEDSSRTALLASIQNFNKNKLKHQNNPR